MRYKRKKPFTPKEIAEIKKLLFADISVNTIAGVFNVEASRIKDIYIREVAPHHFNWSAVDIGECLNIRHFPIDEELLESTKKHVKRHNLMDWCKFNPGGVGVESKEGGGK